MIYRAMIFAAIAHGDQKRKYTGVPYITHPIEVASILKAAGENEDLQIAAILHDTIEDTHITYNNILETFGKKIADIVLEVTDQSRAEDGNRAIRKEIDRIHISKASYEGKTVKLADIISNTSTITKYDKKFAKIYLSEKIELLKVLIDGNEQLHKFASDMCKEYINQPDTARAV